MVSLTIGLAAGGAKTTLERGPVTRLDGPTRMFRRQPTTTLIYANRPRTHQCSPLRHPGARSASPRRICRPTTAPASLGDSSAYPSQSACLGGEQATPWQFSPCRLSSQEGLTATPRKSARWPSHVYRRLCKVSHHILCGQCKRSGCSPCSQCKEIGLNLSSCTCPSLHLAPRLYGLLLLTTRLPKKLPRRPCLLR